MIKQVQQQKVSSIHKIIHSVFALNHSVQFYTIFFLIFCDLHKYVGITWFGIFPMDACTGTKLSIKNESKVIDSSNKICGIVRTINGDIINIEDK